MGLMSTSYENVKRCYRRRRSYQRVNNGEKEKLNVIRLGGGGDGSSRTSTKLRLKKVKMVSPLKMVRRFHEVYVQKMIQLAGSAGKVYDNSRVGGKRVSKEEQICCGCGDLDQIDYRFVLEFYKRIAASRDLSTTFS